MIRKLLWAWLIIGTALMVVGIAHGQVTYRDGPFGAQRFTIGAQGIPGGCTVGPGGRMTCGPNGCPPGGGAQTVVLPPEVPAARAQAREPSPVVVKIESSRDGTTMHGTGSLVGWRAGRGLVLTAAHVLRAGFRVVVRLADGRALPGRVVATDAEHDAALLEIEVPRLRILPLAPRVPRGTVYWEGWGQGSYATTAGQVTGLDGNFLTVRAEPRNGDSGAAIYGPDGSMVGMVTGGARVEGEPWETSGPHVVWIAGFIAQHWPAQAPEETPPPLPMPPANPPGEAPDLARQQLAAEVAALRKTVAALQARIDQPITFRTRKPDGTIIESSEVRLGESQDLFLIPQRRSQ